MPVKNSCLSCSKTFTTISGLTSHCKAKGHTANRFVCEVCNVSFLSSTALGSHMNSPRHADDYDSDSDDDDDPYCYRCKLQFTNMIALSQHLFESSKHNWCFECSRDFKSKSALANHQRSLAHHGRDFKCPFCKRMFKSPSGIAMHIESGCHKFTRHHVTAAVQRMKIIPNISIKRIMGPVQPPTTVRTYIATEASFNGSAYACYLCRKSFRTLSALNGHLNSPAHDDDEFRCPKCKNKFKLISGFVQHLESHSCGLAKTTRINNYFNDLTAQFSRLLKA